MNNLKNQYYILRHGHSKTNQLGIIISDPANDNKAYGLTKTGKTQIKKTIKENQELNHETIIFSSPFFRTKESAEIVKDLLNCDKIYISDKLKERFFGIYEKTSNKNYQKVWDNDQLNENKNNTESPQEVWERLLSLIHEIEQKYSNKKIILISHGDPMQILITGFKNIPANKHRQVEHLNCAEIKKLTF